MKNIRHQNFIKLYGYSLDAQYPLSQVATIDEDTMVLVLVFEFAAEH